jgi:hypothetical protein
MHHMTMSSAVVDLVNVLQESMEVNIAMAWPSEGLLKQFEGESPWDFVLSPPEAC